ncbi:MAG: DUF4981 domain-containing protein [Thermoguttaceae bacterium]|nr:DUF4981 domain-containing protein [Thermoguttaceae bacterium]
MEKLSLYLMGTTLALAFYVCVPETSYGQSRQGLGSVQNATEFDIGWIGDQRVTGVKKEIGHATYAPYSSREALTKDACYAAPWLDSNSDLIMNLNGTWKFRWVKGTKEGPGPSEFQTADLDDSKWDDIRVPMNWEMTGRYNQPTYNNTGYPFHNHPPYAMEGYEEHGIVDHNATGFYRRTFDLPDAWSNKEVFIHFDGVYSCCVVWVNGKFCGYSQGSNNDAEFDITTAVQPGQNQLSVRVYRWCDGSYLEGQDMWRLSGIHRDVYLVAKPKTFVRDHYLTVVDQSADATSGRLQALVNLDNRDSVDAVKTVRMELIDAEGNTVAKEEKTVSVKSNRGGDVALMTPKLSNLSAWSSDRPYLYTVIITQCDQAGKEEMVFATKYGFRNIAVVNKGDEHYFTVNGKRIFFKGANIHDAHPLYGRYVDVETMLKDVTLMKQANLNTVRTSHYPRSPRMYTIFDAFGIYVMDEADLECHGNQGLTRDPNWTNAFVDRNVRMALRDRNHPSVVFWSLGNENGNGDNMRRCYEAVKRLDSRFIHCHGEDSASDMYSEMYTSVGSARNQMRGRNGKPFFICEYAHAMGQAVGNLVDYWQVIEDSSGIVGACIWDWVDQAIYDPARIRDGKLIDANGFHAWTGGYDYDPWFDRHNNNDKAFQGNFLNNGIVTPDRAFTAKLTEVKKVYQHVEFALNGATLTIRNKYPFVNLSDFFYLTYVVRKDGVDVEEGRMDVDVPAGQSADYQLKLNTKTSDDAEYTLLTGLCLKENQLWATAGYRLADEQFVLKKRGELPSIEAQGELKIEENVVSGQDFTVRFNKNGALASYVYKGVELIAGAPEYNDFRRIDNDSEGKQARRDPNDGEGGYNYGDPQIRSHEIVEPLKRQGSKATLTMRATGEKTNYTVVYVVYANGVVEMKATFEPKRRGLRRLGLGMQFAPGFDKIEYYARGPQTNYRDRQTGSYLGRYATTVRDMVDENVHPQTYGDRQDLRDLLLINSLTPVNLRVQTEGMVSFSVSHFDELEWNHILHYTRFHWSDLTKRPELFAHFDYWQRGIGNNSCFSDCCLPKYETPYPGNYQGAEELSYKLRFTPISTDLPVVKQDSGLDKFDFFYAGERPDHKMFIVKDGRVVWRYDDPDGRGEISDAILLSDGRILMAHQYGIREIVPNLDTEKGYSVVWKMDAPNGYEIHSLQPIGTDKILYVQCGRPFEAVVMEIPSMKELKRIPLPFNDGGSHGQMRNVRLTKKGTMLLGSFEYGAAIEFDAEGKELQRWNCPGAWGVEELENGNILVASNRGYVREFNRDGDKVWEFDWSKQGPPAFVKVDGQFRRNVSGQKAHRLKNGNTIITNWQNLWSRETSDSLVPAIQAIETTPDGDVVWKLSAWDEPADLGPSTTIQFLDEPVDRTKLYFGDFK